MLEHLCTEILTRTLKLSFTVKWCDNQLYTLIYESQPHNHFTSQFKTASVNCLSSFVSFVTFYNFFICTYREQSQLFFFFNKKALESDFVLHFFCLGEVHLHKFDSSSNGKTHYTKFIERTEYCWDQQV